MLRQLCTKVINKIIGRKTVVIRGDNESKQEEKV